MSRRYEIRYWQYMSDRFGFSTNDLTEAVTLAIELDMSLGSGDHGISFIRDTTKGKEAQIGNGAWGHFEYDDSLDDIMPTPERIAEVVQNLKWK